MLWFDFVSLVLMIVCCVILCFACCLIVIAYLFMFDCFAVLMVLAVGVWVIVLICSLVWY